MHRRVLEDYLETLWEECGVEFKFVRSSIDQEDMDFFEGSSPQKAGAGGMATGPASGIRASSWVVDNRRVKLRHL